ncbi:hypothetical protein N7463_000465 [Penicillium fimorum]|uniref:Uncharacterized protein n=1 Tax=Penicillium fimorum TaxID=1882269 RepID=A0A9W9Y5Z3_9EURO|nr:hypothetical protein N7463_000465 [Penicillium fimorum]
MRIDNWDSVYRTSSIQNAPNSTSDMGMLGVLGYRGQAFDRPLKAHRLNMCQKWRHFICSGV